MLGFTNLRALLLALAHEATLAAILTKNAGRLQLARESTHELIEAFVFACFNLQWQTRSPPFNKSTGCRAASAHSNTQL
jgi:hypothetical protein